MQCRAVEASLLPLPIEAIGGKGYSEPSDRAACVPTIATSQQRPFLAGALVNAQDSNG
jgi:hypothetical protein